MDPYIPTGLGVLLAWVLPSALSEIIDLARKRRPGASTTGAKALANPYSGFLLKGFVE